MSHTIEYKIVLKIDQYGSYNNCYLAIENMIYYNSSTTRGEIRNGINPNFSQLISLGLLFIKLKDYQIALLLNTIDKLPIESITPVD